MKYTTKKALELTEPRKYDRSVFMRNASCFLDALLSPSQTVCDQHAPRSSSVPHTLTEKRGLKKKKKVCETNFYIHKYTKKGQ